MTERAICVTALGVFLATNVAANSEAQAKPGASKRLTSEPAAPDLVKLITCGATIKEWGAFAMDFSTHPDRAAKWGWKKAKSSGFIDIYDLRRPIVVFGEETSRIGFSGSGVVALVAKPARGLAEKLGMQPVVAGSGTAVFGKTVHAKEEKDEGSGITVSEKISLSVGTSDLFTGQTLAGCSYSTDVR